VFAAAKEATVLPASNKAFISFLRRVDLSVEAGGSRRRQQAADQD
jgi:hypothetical protein